jgi:UDP-glucose 4-epimerase
MTEKVISVLEILEAFEKFNAVKLNYSVGKRGDGDASCMYAAVSKAENTFGWKATLGLRDMVTSAWRWQQM